MESIKIETDGKTYNIDFDKIAYTKNVALNGQFINKDNIMTEYWTPEELTVKDMGDGAILIKDSDCAIGWTTIDSVSNTNSTININKETSSKANPKIQIINDGLTSNADIHLISSKNLNELNQYIDTHYKNYFNDDNLKWIPKDTLKNTINSDSKLKDLLSSVSIQEKEYSDLSDLYQDIKNINNKYDLQQGENTKNYLNNEVDKNITYKNVTDNGIDELKDFRSIEAENISITNNTKNSIANELKDFRSLISSTNDTIENIELSNNSINLETKNETSKDELQSNLSNKFEPLDEYNLNIQSLNILDRQLTESEIEELNNYIKDAVKEDYGTGNGVAAAAQALVTWFEEKGYRLQYYWGGGHGMSQNDIDFIGANPNWGANLGYYEETGPNFGMDCSGFVSWAIRNGCNQNYGSHTTYDMKLGPEISISEAKPGDIMLADSHVRLVIKNNNDGTVITAEETYANAYDAGLVFTEHSAENGYQFIDMSDFYKESSSN